MRSLAIFWAGCLLALVGWGMGCSSDEKSAAPASGPTEEEIDQLEDQLQTQLDYQQQLFDLAATMDTTAALDSLVALLEADPEVDWAVNVRTGVNLCWASGLPGAIVLRLLDEPPPVIEPSTRTRAAALSADELSLPLSGKCLYLAPAYSEFQLWDETVRETADSALPHIGYQEFEMLKDEEVTLERIRAVGEGEYGIIRISSHGVPWPSIDDIQEVYFISGEAATRESFVENWPFIENETLIIGAYAGEKRYFVNSAYFAVHNDLSATNPLVSTGFCFGNLGHWPSDLRNTAKAGAVVGWDWAVYTLNDGPKTERLFTSLCDTSLAEPCTVQQWYEGENKSYYDHEDERTVTIHINAADDFALWKPLEITSMDPSSGREGATVVLEGIGFGSAAGTVYFGTREVSSVASWIDTRIEFTVPEDVLTGTYAVSVEVDGRRSNHLTFSVVDDDLLAKLHLADDLDFYLEAPHVFSSGEPSDRMFWYTLRPLVWDGVNFTAHEERSGLQGTSILDATGTVGPAMDALTCEWSRNFHKEYGDGTVDQSFIHVIVTGVPFTRAYKYFGHQNVEYAAITSEVQAHVTLLEYSYTRTDPGGTVTSNTTYVSTEWDQPEAVIQLICTFDE